jgi:hypothetical protein
MINYIFFFFSERAVLELKVRTEIFFMFLINHVGKMNIKDMGKSTNGELTMG